MSRRTHLRPRAVVRTATRRALWCLALLLCSLILCGFDMENKPEHDYSNSLHRSLAAERDGDLARASSELEHALHFYPDDYALTIRLGWLYFLQERYAEAERAYRNASRVSKQSTLSQLGLAWTLVRQRRCAEARELLATIDASEHQTSVDDALAVCKEWSQLHGSAWTTLGGALYHDHPWKRRSADALVGGSLIVGSRWFASGAYHYLKLQARDARIEGVTQNEGYLQAGYAGQRFGLSLHGALLFAGYSTLGRSEHFAIAARWTRFGSMLLELSGSVYFDMFVTRIAPAWELHLGSLSFVPGLSFEHYSQTNLVSGSLGAAYDFARLSLSAGGKYGPEYRAAYLPRFAVFNSEDRSVWGAWVGVRTNISSHASVFVTYLISGLSTPDKLPSRVQLISLGAAFNF